MIYLDHNASTPMDERVAEVMAPYLHQFFGNPSSLHRQGRVCRSSIDRAREQVAALVGATPSQVVFTSGGTEANNLAIKGWAARNPGLIARGATEHPSVAETVSALSRAGRTTATIAVDLRGWIDLNHLRHLLDHGLKLASIMIANNETGVIQSIPPIVQLLRERNAALHCDGVQAVGKLEVNFQALGIQMLSLSSHKIGGPKGAGALVIEDGIELEPLLNGGGQELGLRGGTENVPAIVGFGKAAELARAEWSSRQSTWLRLRDRLERGIAQIPGAIIFAANTDRLANTVQLGVSGIDGETLVMMLDRAGVAVSSGSACASNAGEPSPVLTAMGIPEGTAKSAIRVSLGRNNDETQIDRLLEALGTLASPHAQVA